MSILSKIRFKDQTFKLRETAILDATTSILGDKGYDLMTMDDVAKAVGISKPVLYIHFKSKEELIGAALIRLIDGAIDYLGALDPELTAIQKLTSLLEWTLRVRLQGGLPFLPSTNSRVRNMLMRNLKYVARILKLNKELEKCVIAAQKTGELNPKLPCDVILFNYYSRTCDPAVEYLKIVSKMNEDEIVRYTLQVTFKGLTSD